MGGGAPKEGRVLSRNAGEVPRNRRTPRPRPCTGAGVRLLKDSGFHFRQVEPPQETM